MNIDDEWEEPYPCDTCGNNGVCDTWDMQFCCTLCAYHYGNDNTPCENCDPYDI